MRKRICLFIISTFLLIGGLFPISADASSYNEVTVFDYADLFTPDEEEDFRKISEKFEEYEISVVFLTTDNAQGKSSMVYLDDFYDANNFRTDGVLFMIDMDNRYIYINTVGKCIDMITDLQIDNALDAAYTNASSSEYALCMKRMSNSICDELESQLNPIASAFKFSYTILLFAIIITAVIIVILIYQHNRANQKTPAARYIGSTFTVLNRNTIFMGCRKEVLHDYYAQQNRSGSGGGGSSHHVSSGSVSHGGGGRSF